MKKIIIATRKSPLALWQANWVKHQLEALHPALSIELLGLTTQADKILDIPLTKIGGKGLFVKELEDALLDQRADIAVHSMKDVPMQLPPGLCLPVMCEREEPRDAFVANDYAALNALPKGAIIGTSSLRRQRQIYALRPDLQMAHLRGNVNTRLAKLDDGEYAGIILAAAGLKRLGLTARIRELLSIEKSLPAAGQGVLGIECRADDVITRELIQPLNHMPSHICVLAERALCRQLNGSCQVPIAAYAEINQGIVTLQGLVAQVDGSLILRVLGSDQALNAEPLGIKMAEELCAKGARSILDCFPK